MSQPRPPVKVSPFEAKTLTWWKVRKNKIDMTPSYQRRGRLWSHTDKAYLIDSILNGFDIPKLYIADFSYSDSDLNERRLPYAIIDGKQRFEAIFDFFEGTVTLNSDFVYLENPSLKLGGLGYRDLTQNYPEVIEVFDTYNLAVMSVITEREELINELFVRLNRSKPLTGAEIRNAMAGPAPEVIRGLSKHEFFADLIAFPVQRGQDLNAASKLLLFEFNERPQETKKNTLDGFVNIAAQKPNQLELAALRCQAMLNEISTIFLPKDRLLGSAGSIPVYYWFIRSVASNHYQRVRDFLVKFEADRRANRQHADSGEGLFALDQELIEYDNYNRSTNDISSHVGRIRILENRFRQYITRNQ